MVTKDGFGTDGTDGTDGLETQGSLSHSGCLAAGDPFKAPYVLVFGSHSWCNSHQVNFGTFLTSGFIAFCSAISSSFSKTS